MATIKRNGGWSVTWRLEGKQRWLATSCRTKTEAQRLERECLAALAAKNFSFITEDARHILLRLHKMMGWAIPDELLHGQQSRSGQGGNGNGIVLWNKEEPEKGAIQRYFADRLTQQKSTSTLDRNSQCFYHLVRLLGATTPIKDIWVPEIRNYYAQRIEEGASPNTVGWELSSLSAVFGVLIADRKSGITENPTALVRGKGKGLNFASEERQAYLSQETLNTILSAFNEQTQRPVIPDWLRPLILCGYYTGMRLSEMLKLKAKQVFLDRRMIFLPDPKKIKERKAKRVPIHRDLHPILERLLEANPAGCDDVFLISDEDGTRPVTKNTVESAYRRMFKVLRPEPRFCFLDLRHTFKANCARSKIPERISERILGHSDKKGHLTGNLPVAHRYGAISDKELVAAIDQLTFDHGDSEINGQPLILNPVSYLLAGNEKQDAQEVEHPAKCAE
jgi:integrase